MQTQHENSFFTKIDNKSVLLSYDESIYSPEEINAVAHFMIGKCQTIIRKDEHTPGKILVKLLSEDQDLKKMADEFNEELINYSFYSQMMKKNYTLRETILQRVLLCAQQKKERVSNTQ